MTSVEILILDQVKCVTRIYSAKIPVQPIAVGLIALSSTSTVEAKEARKFFSKFLKPEDLLRIEVKSF